jgi:hypothetical protein
MSLKVDSIQIHFARFVDRDMVMRYHWGLAIGHTYTHSSSDFRGGHGSNNYGIGDHDIDDHGDDNQYHEGDPGSAGVMLDFNSDENDDWGSDAGASDTNTGEYSDDDTFFAMYEMYGC